MGSRKLLAIAAFAIVGAAACVNGDATTGQVKDAVRDACTEDGQAEGRQAECDEQAECVGNRLEGLNQGQLNEVAEAEDLSTLAGVEIAGSDEDLRELVRGVLSECMGEESPDTTGEEGEEPSSSEGTGSDGDSAGDGSGGE